MLADADYGAAACDTMNGTPAAVNEPILAAPVFAATVNSTVPFPLPENPLVSVIHETFDTDVHAHPGVVVRFVDPLPPRAPTSRLDGAIE